MNFTKDGIETESGLSIDTLKAIHLRQEVEEYNR